MKLPFNAEIMLFNVFVNAYLLEVVLYLQIVKITSKEDLCEFTVMTRNSQGLHTVPSMDI